MNRIRAERGLTLLETVIFLAIAGVIIAAVWIVVAEVNFHNQVAQTEQAVITTAARILDFYKDRPMDTGLTNTVAIDTNLVSSDLIVDGTLQHYLGTSSTVNLIVISSSAVATCGAGQDFYIELQNVRPDACAQLATDLSGTQTNMVSNNIASLLIGGTNVTAGQSLDVSKVETACANSATIDICFQQP